MYRRRPTSRLIRRVTAGIVLVGLAGCTGGTAAPQAPESDGSGSAQGTDSSNRYCQVNLAANTEAYQARFTVPELINAWGIAIRPQGAGGHVWVNAGGNSHEFVGDVTASADPKLRELFARHYSSRDCPCVIAAPEAPCAGWPTRRERTRLAGSTQP